MKGNLHKGIGHSLELVSPGWISCRAHLREMPPQIHFRALADLVPLEVVKSTEREPQSFYFKPTFEWQQKSRTTQSEFELQEPARRTEGQQ